MSTISILHFNDAYRVTPQKVSSRSEETIDVTQFAAMLSDLRDRWPTLPDGKKNGLVLFSGDLFSPSIESTVTRGSHLVPVMNELAPDVALTGNHDFDFGYPHLTKLVQDSKFPWILSNIIDNTTSCTPEYLHEFEVIDRGGIRIGIIGLVEEAWITTVSSWPPNFVYKSMAETGLELSRRLRDPDGEYRCDIIIALTHSRIPNDISLAKELNALSVSAQKDTPIANKHGVDLLLGGHDHLYYISKGVDAWEGYDNTQSVRGADEDRGDVLVMKSGTDFRDLSEIVIALETTPKGSVRNKIVKNITGKRHATQPGSRASESLVKVLEKMLSSVSKSLKAPICKAAVVLDLRSQYIRTEESAAGNWFADVIRHAYDDALCLKGCGGSDGVLICAGTLRGDSTYGPGVVTLGNILEILPFDDPVVVLELDGAAIWEALEASLSIWPAHEGRFPIVAGLRVSWDSRKLSGERVLGIWLTKETNHGTAPETVQIIDDEPIERTKDGRKYKIVTRDYMANGHDGFESLKDKKYLVDHESGGLMSSIVRRYLLGCQFVRKMARITDMNALAKFQSRTQEAISEEQRQEKGTIYQESVPTNHWKRTIALVMQKSRTKAHYQNQLNVSMNEHMSPVDVFDGFNMRMGKECVIKSDALVDDDLLIISPEVDGRMKDEGRM